jgi:hypothetical protein
LYKINGFNELRELFAFQAPVTEIISGIPLASGGEALIF